MKNRYIVIINTILFTKFFPSLMLFRIPPWGWIFEKRMAISGQPAHSSAEKHSSGTVPKRTLNIISCLNCHTTSNLLFRGGKRFHGHFSGRQPADQLLLSSDPSKNRRTGARTLAEQLGHCWISGGRRSCRGCRNPAKNLRNLAWLKRWIAL